MKTSKRNAPMGDWYGGGCRLSGRTHGTVLERHGAENVPIAQMAKRTTDSRKAEGSNPSRNTKAGQTALCEAHMARLAERPADAHAKP